MSSKVRQTRPKNSFLRCTAYPELPLLFPQANTRHFGEPCTDCRSRTTGFLSCDFSQVISLREGKQKNPAAESEDEKSSAENKWLLTSLTREYRQMSREASWLVDNVYRLQQHAGHRRIKPSPPPAPLLPALLSILLSRITRTTGASEMRGIKKTRRATESETRDPWEETRHLPWLDS